MGTSTSRPPPRGRSWAAVRRAFADPDLSPRQAVVRMAGALDEPAVASLSGSGVAEALDGLLRRSQDIAAAAGDEGRLRSLASELRESLQARAVERKDASQAGELARQAATRTLLTATSPSSGARTQLASAFLRAYVAGLFAHLAAGDLSRSVGRGQFVGFGQISAFVGEVQSHVQERAGEIGTEELAASRDAGELQEMLAEQIRRLLERLKQDPHRDVG